MVLLAFLLIFLFLLALFGASAMRSALRRLGTESPKQLDVIGNLFFYQIIHQKVFKKATKVESLFFALSCTQYLMRFLVIFLLTLFTLPIIQSNMHLAFLFGFVSLIILFTVGDFLPRLLGTRYPKFSLKSFALCVSPFLIFTLPITVVFLLSFNKGALAVFSESPHHNQDETKREIIQFIERSGIESSMDPIDKSLIESVVSFHDRIAREIMVPRIDVCALAHNTPISEAAKVFNEEGYSRIPIYKNNIDTIIGILMFKDILKTYLEQPDVLQKPVESIVKGMIYTPETKKISHLLQEFRSKQVHMAIVVDEYGGTEGIVTIEDILEEIVGEIADEFDVEEQLYSLRKEGGWIVDPRMSIYDIEADMEIKIPQEGDYDTLGGFIFHRAGSIPSKGFIIHHENFTIEILKSDERSVLKVKVLPYSASGY